MTSHEPYQRSPGHTASGQESRHAGRGCARRCLLSAVAITLGVVLWTQFGDYLSLEQLASKEGQLRALQENQPVVVGAVAFLFYAAATGLSLPGAAILTVVYGWVFGFMNAFIIVSFASTAGATLAFLLSRFLFRDVVRNRFGDKLEQINATLEKEGPFYLFTLRLIPAFPFFLINILMGLTPMKTSTYWWVSQLGMLPGTMAYAFAGSSVPNLATLARDGTGSLVSAKLIVAFAVLGTFPLIIRAFVSRRR
jgi:uncharacterized membrane protein YdjX (TVP38/TMEM64 family)